MRLRLRPSVFVLATVALALACGRARAEACGTAGRWVSFAVVDPFEPRFADAARAHLAAELATRGIPVCAPSADGPPPSARVTVTGDPAAAIVLRIDEDATGTTVQRRVDLSAVPATGRALAFGVAADELLTSAWSALAIGRGRAPPVVAAAAPAASLSVSTWALGLAVSALQLTDGPALFGPDLGVSVFRGRFGARLGVGLRVGAPVASAHGDVALSDVHASSSVHVTALRIGPRVRLGPVATVELARVTARGAPDPGASSADGAALAVLARGGVEAAFAFAGRFAVVAQADAGRVVRPVRARDDGVVVTSVEGTAWLAAMRLEVVF